MKLLNIIIYLIKLKKYIDTSLQMFTSVDVYYSKFTIL